PVRVLKGPGRRVSPLPSFRGFAPIGGVNLLFGAVSLFFHRPCNHFPLVKKKGIKRFFFEDLLQSTDPPSRKALSVSLGILVGMSPLWGLHTVTVLSLAYLFRLNKVIAFACSNVSIPPMIPLIIYGGLSVGAFLLDTPLTLPPRDGDAIAYWSYAKSHLVQYAVGSLVLALVSAALLRMLAY